MGSLMDAATDFGSSFFFAEIERKVIGSYRNPITSA